MFQLIVVIVIISWIFQELDGNRVSSFGFAGVIPVRDGKLKKQNWA